MLPENTTTIEEFIRSSKNTTISYPSLSFSNKTALGGTVSVSNVINDYLPEMIAASVNVKLTNNQQRKYFYKPKLLCHDMYGNPELYYIILLMNDMADVKEFTKPIVKMLRKDYMSMILSDIYNSEKSAINAYNKKITSSI